MTKDKLKQLSTDTFISNNKKKITAQDHRYFNEQLIDTMATARQIKNTGWQSGNYTPFTDTSNLYWFATNESLILSGYVTSTASVGKIRIADIPEEYLNRVILNFKFPVDVYTGNSYNKHIIFKMAVTEGNLEIILWENIAAINSTYYFNTVIIPLEQHITNNIEIGNIGTDITFGGITYGNNKIVAANSIGQYAYSSDGRNWTVGNTGVTNPLYSITYGNGKFVAVSSNGEFACSEDLVTWQTGETGYANYLLSLIYADNRFVAVGKDRIVYSEDGINWNIQDWGIANIDSIAYGNGRFVGIGSSGKCVYSEDGENWTTVYIEKDTTNWKSITFGNNMFVAVGTVGKCAYSKDGENWTTVSIGNDIHLYNIAFGNNMFVAFGEPYTCAYTVDGKKWSIRSTEDIFVLRSVFANNKIIAVGQIGKYAIFTVVNPE